MSGYGEMAVALERRAFVDHWCPETLGDGLIEANEENLRWNIARARAAEDELRRIKDALKTLKATVR